MNNAETDSQNWFVKNRKLLIRLAIVLGIIVVVGIAILGFLGWQNGIENDGRTQQNNIVQLQKDVEKDISTCLDTSRLSAQIASQEFDRLKDVLTNVVSARYEGGDGALSQGSPIVSMLQERYPTIDQSSWKIVMSTVIGCRQEINDSQKRLQNYATNFKTWYMTGGIFEKGIRNDFPTDDLQAVNVLTSERLTGKAALDYLTRNITTKEAKDAMKNGTLPNQELFPSAAPSPQPTR